MRKVVIRNWMALDIITASQGGTYAIIKTECCNYTPDESGNVTSLLGHMHKQIKSLRDPI